MSFSPTPVYTPGVTSRVGYNSGPATGVGQNFFVAEATCIVGTSPSLLHTDTGIFTYNGKSFQVCHRASWATSKTSLTPTGRSYISVWGASDPTVAWAEKDAGNAPETGCFVYPETYQASPIYMSSARYTVTRVDKYLYISYFTPISYDYTFIPVNFLTSGILAMVRFDMDTETYGVPDVSTAIYAEYNGANVNTQPAVTFFFTTGPYGTGQSVYRRQTNTIYVFENTRTIISLGVYWNRPAYAKYVIGTGWVEESDPVDSWHLVGTVAGGNHDQAMLGVTISDDGIIRLLLAELTWNVPSYTHYTEQNVQYQTMDLTDTLSALQDTGFGPASTSFMTYFAGADELFGRPRCDCNTIAMPLILQVTDGGSQHLSIKCARASLTGDAPVWTVEDVATLVDFNTILPNIAGCVLTFDLSTIVYCVYTPAVTPGTPTYQLRVATRSSSGVWTDAATPASPVPILYTDYVDAADTGVFDQHVYEKYWRVDAGSTTQDRPAVDNSTVFVGLTGCLWTRVDVLSCSVVSPPPKKPGISYNPSPVLIPRTPPNEASACLARDYEDFLRIDRTILGCPKRPDCGQILESEWIEAPKGAAQFNKNGHIALPAPAANTTVISLRVPFGYDGILTGHFHTFTLGFDQGSGDLIWRVRVNGRYLRDMGRMLFLFGSLQNLSPCPGGLWLYSGNLIEYIVEAPNTGGSLPAPGLGQIIAGLSGWFFPRK